MTTCQICERVIKTVQSKTMVDVIAHHGYQRPHGEGWQSASCWGARHLCYEVSCDQIAPCIAYIKEYVKNRKAHLKDFMQNPPATLTRTSLYNPPRIYEKPEGFNAEENDKQGSWSGQDQMYGYEHHSTASLIRMGIRNSERDITRLEKRLADWKPVANSL